MKRIIAIFFLCQVASLAVAQFEQNYLPIPFLDTIPEPVAQDLKEKLRMNKEACQEPKSQVNSFLKSLYEKRHEYLVKSINDDLFIVDHKVTGYLQSILDEIYRGNSALQGRAQVVVVRSESPNAMSFGEGTIGITLGLLSRLETDAQVAFVICHEMAHFHANHSDKDLRALARLNYDKELKKKIDDVRKSEYNRYTRLKEIFKGMGFSITQHSRGHEFEADSLGLSYLKNTRFNPASAIRVMEILDSVDAPKRDSLIDLKKFLDFKTYPFKPSWTTYTKSTTWYASTKIEDSLRTHPDCKKRIVALKRQQGDLKTGEDFVTGEGIRYYNLMSEFELVESLYHFKEYGKALFTALQLAEIYPRNTYLHAHIGRGLFQLYSYQKNHEFGKVTELPDPRFPENYDRYLTFIHKLRLGELSSLSYNYVTHCPETDFEDEEFIYSLWLVSTLAESKVDPDKVKDAYLAKYPDGRYGKKMKLNPKY